MPESITSLTNGGYPSSTAWSKFGANSPITRRISPLLLPGATTVTA
jgi:hypothetical protein